CLNLGVTFPGLKALRLSEDSLASFPEEFRQGAVAQAASLGNTGDSAPENWIGGLNTPEAHVLLSLFAQKDAELARVTGQLRGLFAGGGLAELSDHVGKALPDNRVHFGYKDGIAQPNIDGSSAEVSPDMQPVAPTGEFLLGYPSQWKD